MKGTELRIGNYVNIGLKSSSLRTDFDAITASGLMDLQVNKETSSFVYEPIPLTEEFILDLGFETEVSDWCHFTLEYDFEYYIDISLSFSKEITVNIRNEEDVFYFNVEYVHQLQNLYFTLTNEELTINQI